MSMEWWRCKHGAPFDPKWRAIALRAQARPGDVWAVFTTLCDRASQASDRGSLCGLDVEDVAAGLGYELVEVERIIAALRDKGLVTEERVTTWEKHQPKREDTSTERVRAHRNAMKRDETQSPPREEKIREDTDSEKKPRKSEGGALRASQPKPPSKAQRWPKDAVVSDDWLLKAADARAEHNLPQIDLRLEATQFANYWAAKSGGGAAKLDWEATWINWALKAYTNGKQGQSRQSSVGNTLREIANDIADLEAGRAR